MPVDLSHSGLLATASVAGYLQESWGAGRLTAGILAALLHAVLLIVFFGAAALVYIWLERKVAGRIQDRLGPTRVGGRFGWLQTLADGLKLIQKEDLCPDAADRLMFLWAPYIAAVASFAALIALPFADGWVAMVLDAGLFFILAVMSLEVFGIILAGYSSGSKWALFGAMREAAQMVSYEIPMAIAALVPVMAAGTLNLLELGRMQAGLFTNWLIFVNPFTFLAFFVYFTVATASVKRAPFDLAEAESELVAGFHTEYSGLRWSIFFLAEYASMFAVSGIACYLFLGGFHDGLNIVAGVHALLGDSWAAWVCANLLSTVVFILKGTSLVFVQMWARWTLPRLRIDQVMMTCLKYLIPMSCGLFLLGALWPLVLLSSTGRGTLLDGPLARPLGERLVQAVDGSPRAATAAAKDANGGVQ